MHTVKDVMSSPVLTIAPDAPVSEAMRAMKQQNISSLIVPMRGGGLGIITQRDVVRNVVAAGRDPSRTTVGDICTPRAVAVSPDLSLRECSARMVDLGVRRFPVTDEDQRLLGIVSETDIFMAVEERGWGPDEFGESKLRAIGTLARIRRTTVEEVMSKPVAMIEADAKVADALSRMAERGISSLIVSPQAGTAVYGIVTKRDIIGKVVAQNRDPQTLRVAHIMSSPIYTIRPHVTLPICAARMVEWGVRRLTVVEHNQPIGIISDTDIFRAVEGRNVSLQERARASAVPPFAMRHVTKSHVHTAADVMGREAFRIPADATIAQALAMMEARSIESVLIEPQKSGGDFGIVTQRDIISKVVAQEQDPDVLKVWDIATAPLITVPPTLSISECSALMIERNIRRLPVQDGDDIIGIVRDTDIFAAVEERGWEAEVSSQSAVASSQKAERMKKVEGRRQAAVTTTKRKPTKRATPRKAVGRQPVAEKKKATARKKRTGKSNK